MRSGSRRDRAADRVAERDYPNTYRRFTALGPLVDKLGNEDKGIEWGAEVEVAGPEILEFAW